MLDALYAVLVCDRHLDPKILLFVSREDAIEAAKLLAEENARHTEGIMEEKIEGWEYYCRYSVEGDYVRVTREVLHQPDFDSKLCA